VDAVVRNRPVLLIGLGLGLAACSPAKGTPVGLSTGGAEDGGGPGAAASSVPLARVPADFRTSWTRSGGRIVSEHGQLAADVYGDSVACAAVMHDQPMTGACRFVEDLYRGDAGVGVYLLEHSDAGTRFAVAQPVGRTLADDAWDGGSAALDPCARCHAEAPRAGVFPIPSSVK
jgi:hypothetical protein